MKSGYIISGFAGAIIGGVSAYFILKKIFKEQADKEAEEIVKYYKKKGYAPIKKKEEEDSEESVNDNEPESEEVTAAQKHHLNIVEKMNYNTLSSKKEVNAKDIFTITPESFANDRSYDKVVLEYYTDDVQLADLQGERYDGDITPEQVKKFEDFFGEYEEDLLYLRYENISTDFEIARQIGSLGDFLDED